MNLYDMAIAKLKEANSLSTLYAEQKYKIWYDFNNVEGTTKAQLGRDYGVSSRTIGRSIDEVERVVNLVKATTENVDATFPDYDTCTADEAWYDISLMEMADDVVAVAQDCDGSIYAYHAMPYPSLIDGEFGVATHETCECLYAGDDVIPDWQSRIVLNERNVSTKGDDVETETAYDYTVTANRRSIHITRFDQNDNEESVVIDSSHHRFNEVFEIISVGGLSNENLEKAYENASVKEYLEKYSAGRITVDLKTQTVSYTNDKGMVINLGGKLVPRILDSIGDKYKFKCLASFANLLLDNPSYRAVNELYGFLEHNDIEIDEDGFVICWKKVRDDYTDVYTGTYDNSPGKTVEMLRNEVNEDSTVTCSAGLHVAARHYINVFNGSRVIKVRVNPADFVAIPIDYNNSKARVSKYVVVEDVTSKF